MTKHPAQTVYSDAEKQTAETHIFLLMDNLPVIKELAKFCQGVQAYYTKSEKGREYAPGQFEPDVTHITDRETYTRIRHISKMVSDAAIAIDGLREVEAKVVEREGLLKEWETKNKKAREGGADEDLPKPKELKKIEHFVPKIHPDAMQALGQLLDNAAGAKGTAGFPKELIAAAQGLTERAGPVLDTLSTLPHDMRVWTEHWDAHVHRPSTYQEKSII